MRRTPRRAHGRRTPRTTKPNDVFVPMWSLGHFEKTFPHRHIDAFWHQWAVGRSPFRGASLHRPLSVGGYKVSIAGSKLQPNATAPPCARAFLRGGRPRGLGLAPRDA